ncbi:MAG: class I SAM-dependent methyltransferase [Rhodoblastus sp.]|uniref:class I SAM-dependent methyltransferase n=1 Tax=Rhodoblastus sp. TaxID=1962975 RepID=UPI003F99191F
MNEQETEGAFRFTGGDAYERFMGPWSRAVGDVFLDWLAIPEGRRWLDLGCGTGAFTQLLVERAHPAAVVAIDPAPAQIEHARARPVAQVAYFRVADAEELPFDDASFDVVASALVLNFIPDRTRALAEMRRVVRPGGCVAGYVWDFTGDLSVTRHMTDALRSIEAHIAPMPGVKSTRIEALKAMFDATGLIDVDLRTIEVERTYPDFDAYWRIFLENPSPASAFIQRLPKAEYDDLRRAVQSSLPIGVDGSISFAARANAVRGFAPG